jgi:hypothetical protein
MFLLLQAFLLLLEFANVLAFLLLLASLLLLATLLLLKYLFRRGGGGVVRIIHTYVCKYRGQDVWLF